MVGWRGKDAVVPVGLKFSVGASQLGEASSNHDKGRGVGKPRICIRA
jgi:hypothetical protein